MTKPAGAASDNEARMRSLLISARERIERYQQERDEKIAVVGMAARLPGAADLDAFWDLLAQGKSGLRRVAPDELDAAGVAQSAATHEDYVPVWGGPPEADGFDAAFFGYAPREAELLDPQQRMFLECAWHALEDAGYDSLRVQGAIGVYAGASLSGHLLRTAGRAGAFEAGLANIGGMVAARTSFHLNLKGPSIGVQTTCSSSLVALHQAIQGLRQRDCDMALAGAVAVNQPRPEGYSYQQEGIAAPDGHCRPFDADAAGTVFSNGAGVVVLKRLSDALAAGDMIHGILVGVAVNNDGADKISLTAPSVSGQAAVLDAALAAARLGAGDIDYVEAHGTGTALGDPIELTALDRSYGPGLAQSGRRCALGSVKGDLGHLDAAAGMAGLIKILLALRHEYLPATANFSTPSPKCNFGAFDVMGEGRDWPRDPTRIRRAGLSSFGIGGTNTHLIVEEPPLAEATSDCDRAAHILPLSARTPEALAQLREDLAAALSRGSAPDLADVAFTLQVGRRVLEHRQVIMASTSNEAIAELRNAGGNAAAMEGRPNPVFVFSGQGSQHPGMCRDLHAQEPVFRAAMEECLSHMPQDLGLREMLLDPKCGTAARIHETRHAQPALFALEYALARLWIARGVQPVAMLGHSIGEYAAACIAGVFDLADAAKLVCARGALMQKCAPGAMLSVMMSEAEAADTLPDGVEIAAVNGPRSVVLSGNEAVIDDLAQRFDRSGIGARKLRTSHAFHSSMMEPALETFREALEGTVLHPPQIAILSNVTGTWLTAEQATDPGYWVRHLRAPVRFGDGVAELLQLEHPLLLEVGPGAGLIRLARQQLGSKGRGIASLPDSGKSDGAAEIRRATGALWAAGASIDWPSLHDGPRRRVSLPGYPFERQSFWLPPASSGEVANDEATDPADWFYQPVWQRVPLPQSETPALRRLFLGVRPAEFFQTAIYVSRAEDGVFQATNDGFVIDPTDPRQYEMLFDALAEGGQHIDEIVCAWGLGEAGAYAPLLNGALALGRALASREAPQRLTLLGAGMHEVTGREALDPNVAMAQGLIAVLRQEITGLECRSIDLDPADPGAGLTEALALPWDKAPIALRGGYLWRGGYARTPLKPRDPAFDLPKCAPLLITGDLAGGFALTYARALRGACEAPIALAGQGVPQPDDWDGWLATHGPQDPASRTILGLRQLGDVGRDILVFSGDAGDAGWLEQVVREAEDRLGPIVGVFHTAAMGDAYFHPLGELTSEVAARVIDDKRRTVRALRQVLAKRSVKFCLVQSSLSVLAGGHGFAVYAAANAWLDAEIALARREGGTVWQAVQWDVAETGSLSAAAQEASSLRILTQNEVWQATCAVLAQPGAGLVAVTPGSLDQRLKQRPQQAPEQVERARSPRSAAFVAPRDEYERAVAKAMQEMLGVPDVGADDNFFELGGHSLLAIQIINRLRKDFGVDLPVRAVLYEAPTVAGIAGVIRAAAQAAEAEAGVLDDLLGQFESEKENTAG